MNDMRIGSGSEGARMMAALLPPGETAIVPKNSIAGRSLVAVVAIMTFLSSLTLGAVVLVRAVSSDWQSDVAREVTIQVRPVQGKDTEAEVERAIEVARGTPGVESASAYSKEASAQLLEPWLGTGLSFDELPVPRIIMVRLAASGRADLAALGKVLSERVPGASLDDHRAWIERMRAMANTSVIGGIMILIMMLVATVLSVAFATRGAMAMNRPIVEVLHFVGAKDSFIASQFQRHFLILGLKGGVIGGGIAIVVFAIVGIAGRWGRGTAGGDQLAALFGDFSIGIEGYIAVIAQIALIAAVTAFTSRQTVNRTLASVE